MTRKIRPDRRQSTPNPDSGIRIHQTNKEDQLINKQTKKEESHPMDNELEQKRKEKVEGFKINFGDLDDFSDDPANTADTVTTDESFDLDSGNTDLSDESESYENIGTYADNGSDITSYSDDLSDDTEQVLNKSELRAAKRYDKKRRRFKAKKNRIIYITTDTKTLK